MIKVKGLTLHCGGSQILHGIDFETKQGEAICIIGTNGGEQVSLRRCRARIRDLGAAWKWRAKV